MLEGLEPVLMVFLEIQNHHAKYFRKILRRIFEIEYENEKSYKKACLERLQEKSTV